MQQLIRLSEVVMASGMSGLCAAVVCCAVSTGLAQQAPVIVQPGAPGQPSRTLTETTAVAEVRPPSEADVRFMQDMIMHHGQAVEMTELLKTRSKNPEVQELGRKIDVSQSDEIRWMKQWLAERAIPLQAMTSMPRTDPPAMDHSSMAGMDHSKMDHSSMAGMDHSQMPGMDHGHAPDGTDPMDVAMMPGMLTPRQMDALRHADGEQFDRLFLTGMIQHHSGALLMVKQLFAAPGAGQDPQLFDFANDVDNTQLAEIDIMKGILRKVNP
jgi:uncharacterized protein (DUF305 family)